MSVSTALTIVFVAALILGLALAVRAMLLGVERGRTPFGAPPPPTPSIRFSTPVVSAFAGAFGAAVVYYGGSPTPDQLRAVRVPVLGLYGSDDARVNATVPAADSAMRALSKPFEHHTYEGAGHGFLRQQDGKEGANMAASRQAWPATLAFFRRHLGS